VVSQTAHGFLVGEAIYYTGITWAKAKADSADTLGIGLVSVVTDADNFTVALPGIIVGLTGLVSGQYYFVSTAIAGQLTTTEPTTGFSNPLLFATSTTSGIVLGFRPSDTQIGTANLSYTASPTNGLVISDTGTDATIPLADNTNSGLMAPAQVTKLSGIEAGATADQTGTEIVTAINTQLGSTVWQQDTNTTNLSYTASPTNGLVASDTGTDATLPLADGTNAGLMAPAQVTKLSGIEAGATADQTGTEIVTAINTQLGNTTWQSGGGGDFVFIAQHLLGADSATLTLSSIPQNYTILKFVFCGRNDGANPLNMNLTINDNTNNAHYLRVVEGVTPTNDRLCGIVSNANAAGPSSGVLEFVNYSKTDQFKPAYGQSAYSSGSVRMSFTYLQNAAITKIELQHASGNFKAGSYVRIYGIT
jgi:hypothetical protein